MSIVAAVTVSALGIFVHSYYVDPTDPEVKAATVTHGSQTVTAVIATHNLMAAQFHPEKSSTAGLQILSNFVQQVRSGGSSIGNLHSILL